MLTFVPVRLWPLPTRAVWPTPASCSRSCPQMFQCPQHVQSPVVTFRERSRASSWHPG